VISTKPVTKIFAKPGWFCITVHTKKIILTDQVNETGALRNTEIFKQIITENSNKKCIYICFYGIITSKKDSMTQTPSICYYFNFLSIATRFES